jgi:NAD(P)-dependent dehydrogenase (short-subunit alcohol dehydrogenase family)
LTAERERVALVTGGAGTIGRAVVARLLTDGWRVVAAGRDASRLAALQADLGGRLIGVPADVADPAGVAELFRAIRDRAGRLDLLFNNAGVFGPSAPIEDVAYEDWRAVVDVNLTGSFLCAQEAFRLMRDQRPGGGRIINNGSIAAQVPRPGTAPYSAAKHAVTGLTKALALEGRTHAIACGQIDIGNAATAATAGAFAALAQPDGRRAPEPTFDVSHVADAVAYMAGLPLDANVQFMTVMATAMPFVGRG